MSGHTAVEFLEAFLASAHELATSALGFDASEELRRYNSLPTSSESAYIAMVGERTSVQLGLTTNAEGCRLLARAILALGEDEGDLPPADVADAMGEISNILAGRIKTLVASTETSINLGIPIFLHGHLEVSEGTDIAAADMRLGPVPVTVLVLMSRKGR
jgi:CheY-specific phosphatase CheX